MNETTKKRKWIKRILIVCIAAIVLIVLLGVYYKYGEATLDQTHASDISSYTDAFSLSGLRAKDGWTAYAEKALEDGTWYGGIAKDGVITSCAQSSTKRTRVYIRVGAWDEKHWSGWSDVGEKSIKQIDARFGTAGAVLLGTWYGYEAK